jgi:hypothetical protein
MLSYHSYHLLAESARVLQECWCILPYEPHTATMPAIFQNPGTLSLAEEAIGHTLTWCSPAAPLTSLEDAINDTSLCAGAWFLARCKRVG